MSNSCIPCDQPHVALGPEMPAWGSWDWLGADLQPELSHCFRTTVFGWGEVPKADVVLVIKHRPPERWWHLLPESARVIYCPVDHYCSAAEIDADARVLRRCARIVVHCERLRKYFTPYAHVEYLDHHVKFVGPLPEARREDGPLLWIGVRTNLPHLVGWVNTHGLPRELLVLTNPEDRDQALSACDFSFRRGLPVRMELWSADRHQQALGEAVAALDIKGSDFCQRHKPPAKALDFVAAGLPLAMNQDSSSVEHLARLGFDVAAPDDPDCWLSQEYWEETQRFGRAIRELHSLKRIARRYRRIIGEMWNEQSLTERRIRERLPLT